jgi:hypothetical protein
LNIIRSSRAICFQLCILKQRINNTHHGAVAVEMNMSIHSRESLYVEIQRREFISNELRLLAHRQYFMSKPAHLPDESRNKLQMNAAAADSYFPF